MAKQLSPSNRVPAMKAVLALVMVASLAGCASKNPLMDDTSPSLASSTAASAKTTTADTDGTGAQTTGPTGARRLFGYISPHRVTIQQGNFVSKEMLLNLKEGMTRDQVRFALGTPLLTDLFHANRWDYIFRLTRGNGETTRSRVTVFFKDDRVARFEGGDLPTENDYLARIAGAAPAPAKAPVPAVPVPVPSSAPEPSKQ
jgi:outer membrane protein assembly factor BamE